MPIILLMFLIIPETQKGIHMAFYPYKIISGLWSGLSLDNTKRKEMQSLWNCGYPWYGLYILRHQKIILCTFAAHRRDTNSYYY